MSFCRYVAKAKLFCEKSCPGYSGWGVHMGKFSKILATEITVAEISYMSTSKYLRRKEWRANSRKPSLPC